MFVLSLLWCLEWLCLLYKICGFDCCGFGFAGVCWLENLGLSLIVFCVCFDSFCWWFLIYWFGLSLGFRFWFCWWKLFWFWFGCLLMMFWWLLCWLLFDFVGCLSLLFRFVLFGFGFVGSFGLIWFRWVWFLVCVGVAVLLCSCLCLCCVIACNFDIYDL